MPKRILYIGTPQTHDQYVQGLVPSHWLYGAVEMEKEGHQVIWEKEGRSFWHDVSLVRKYKPDLVFIPNLNLHSHQGLLLLSALQLCGIPVFAYLHHEPKVKRGLKSYFYRLLLSGCRHLFFLSELTMEQTVKNGLVSSGRCSVPGWGPDLDFFRNVKTDDEGYYVSTGKENRDFSLLIEVFRKTGLPLKILTSRKHAGANYEKLPELCRDVPNIEVVITENTGEVYPQMLEAMAHAHALVCPLRKDRIKYCVGLSTIADAEGLHKPLVITRNLYHDEARVSNFNVVDSVEDWCQALEALKVPEFSGFSMEKAYAKMKSLMNL